MADVDIEDATDYGSIVRSNLMKRPGYAPYCGCCLTIRRMVWDGDQFECWMTKDRTEFPDDFIAGYKARCHHEADQ